MGCLPIYGSIAVGTYNGSHKRTTHPAFDGSRAEPKWSWQQVSPKTWKDRNRWVSLWPRGQFSMAANDGSYAGAPVGLDYSGSMGYEPFSCDGPGTQSTKFLKGMCVDASDVAISGAVVQGFRTADDKYLGYDVQSRDDGSYDLPTNLPASASYVVAYIAGSPDRGGTTLNTLTPTNIDGS